MKVLREITARLRICGVRFFGQLVKDTMCSYFAGFLGIQRSALTSYTYTHNDTNTQLGLRERERERETLSGSKAW